VNYYFILPADHGGKIAIREYYTALSEWFDITIVNIVGFRGIFKDEIVISEHVKIVLLTVPKSFREIFNNLAMCYNIAPYTSDITRTMAIARLCGESYFVERLKEIAKDSAIIITEHVYAYRLVKEVSEGKLLLYRAQNVENDFRKFVWHIYDLPQTVYDEILELEKDCCAECDLVLTITEDDAMRFQKLYGIPSAKTLNISAGYDADKVKFTKGGERMTSSKKIIGLFISSPASVAVDAAKAIIAAASELSQVEFKIAGGVGSKLNGEIPANVHVLGGVTEEQKLNLLATADFALNPIVGGSGLNIKMLEYFAAGLPIICTQFALRGIEGTDKVHCLITEVADLAETIQHFCDMEISERDKIAQNAYELYQKSHTWRNCAIKTVARLQELMPEIDLQSGIVPIAETKLIEYPEEPGFIPEVDVYIYGSGHYGTTCLSFLSRQGIVPLAFLDRDENKQGTIIQGIPVQAPASFLGNPDEYNVIFALDDFGDAMRDLLSWGLKPSRVVIAHNGVQLIQPSSGRGITFYMDSQKLQSVIEADYESHT
jgi:glycosyltransferase involved in cell wall biosynthesis